MPRHARTAIVVLMAGLFGLIALSSRATVVELIPFDRKVEEAAGIMLGKCVRSESRWTGDERRIVTYYTFAVEKVFKGNPVPEAVIVLPGGAVGNIRQATIGVPEPEIGREYVFFIRNTSVGATILYFEQGLYEVRRGVRGEREVIPPFPDAVMVDEQSGTAVPVERAMTLRDFEARVRDTIRRRTLRMEMVEKQKQQSSSFLAQVKRNKTLVVLALIAIVLAIWMLVRR